MRSTEHLSKSASSSKAGFVALLGGLFGSNGTSAPSAGGSRASARTPSRRPQCAVAITALSLAIFACSASSALAATPEAPETGKANPATITATTATLEDGVLNPHATGEVGEYEYRFKVSATECEGESSTAPGVSAGSEKEAVPPVELTNLQPNATYTFCLIERNLAEEYSPASTPAHFKTKPAPPAILSESAPAPKATEATLHATINPENQATKYQFEYSTKETKGALEAPIVKVPATQGTIAAAFEEHEVEAPTEVLLPGTVYYYRVTAENAKGEKATPGKVESFLTGPPETPVEAKVKADSTTATSVEVEGVLNPVKVGEPGSTYEFLYKEGSECEGGNAASESSQGNAKEHVSQKIGGLKPNVEYTFCLLATNAAGEKTSATAEPVTFSAHAGAPVISEGSATATNITETTATITAKVNPEGLETHVYVEYGNGQDTAPLNIGAVVGEQEVSFALKGLTANTSYPFHVVAFSGEGNGESKVETEPKNFSTLAPPLAHGQEPWFHLSSGARPSYLKSGVGKDEQQEIAVYATSGQWFVKPLTSSFSLATVVPYDATEAELTKVLEVVYGPGNAKAEEGKHDTAAVHSWVITFTGERADQPVPPVKTGSIGGIFGLEELKGGTKNGQTVEGERAIEVNALTEGKPDGELIATTVNVGDATASECQEVAAGTGKYTESKCETEGSGAEAKYEKQPVQITDTLPHGLQAVSAQVIGDTTGNDSHSDGTCTLASAQQVTCTVEESMVPFKQVEVRVGVVVQGAAKECLPSEPKACEENQIGITGGGARSVQISRPVTINQAPTPFGVQDLEQTPEEAGGAPDTQAGSHPFQFTTTFVLNQTAGTVRGTVGAETDETQPVAQAKDLSLRLPPGLIGNPDPFKQCTLAQFNARPVACPPDTVLGVSAVTVDEPGVLGLFTRTVPLFNLEPQTGEPARFGFLPTKETPVFLDTKVRTGEGYGVVVDVPNITQEIGFVASTTTFWGVPGAAAHDNERGVNCLVAGGEAQAPCQPLEAVSPPPFLQLPGSCTNEPLHTEVLADSWDAPSDVVPFGSPMPQLDGCNQLPFHASIKVTPDVEEASKPSGLNVDVHVPQEEALNAEGFAPTELRNITVELPAGVHLNPSASDGLQACSEGLAGYLAGESSPPEDLRFTATIPGGDYSEALREPGVNVCPNASKVATVTVHSPLLPNPVNGFVYLASQEQNPFSSVFAMYILAEDPVSGTVVKLAGEVSLCKAPGEDPLNGKGEEIPNVTCQELGQIVSTFKANPQLPFEDAEIHFFGGERAPLATPARCGSYTTNATFEPWSAEPSDAAALALHESSTFKISTGAGDAGDPPGTGCPGASLPFSPSLTGGALNVNAGAFSPFTATFTRQSGEQNMQSVEVHLPPGMSGDLSNVEQCPEPQANEGKCGPNSLIGETTVSVGVGGEPYTVSGGKFYLTGPYNGSGGCTPAPTNPGCAPFGVTFVVPAKAGPFDLANTQHNRPACDCVLVRGKIEVNPETAAITLRSNPPGTPGSIPTQIEGIPLEIQHINGTTTRGNFQFNPTNCSKLEATGTIDSSEGATDNVSEPFQVTNCAALKFEPKVAISTQGKTSKSNGASLTYKLTYPNVPQGTDADIHYVKVELPKALPSRLTTLQKACTQAQFKANPAGCPSASLIGHAKAVVPNIPVPLEGPVYFVSNGGEAFPNLVIVLQGYNVRIDLIGDTFISKSGITSTTFKTVPDNPVYSFEINLPEGPYSALAANGNLCRLTTTKIVKKKVKVKVHGKTKTVTRKVKEQVSAALQMPNEYIAQNGAVVKKTVPISVTGCGKAKPAKKVKKKKKGKGSKKGKK